jgi:hypothetical protein
MTAIWLRTAMFGISVRTKTQQRNEHMSLRRTGNAVVVSQPDGQIDVPSYESVMLELAFVRVVKKQVEPMWTHRGW